MKLAVYFLLAGLVLTLIAVPATADGYADGTVEDGYTYKGGYWYYYNNPYTRTRVTTPGYTYYSCGRCYQSAPTYSYSYSLYTGTVAPAYVAPTPLPAVTDSSWRTQLLAIAKQRDQGELALRKLSVEHAAYLESINALGLGGNFHLNNYGQPLNFPNLAPGYGGYGNNYNYNKANYNLGNYGANGNTLYGYSYQTVKEAYGETNMNTLYQQASRLTASAQQLGGQAHTEFAELVAAAGNNQARVAEILARARAAEAVFRATEPQAAVKTTTTVTGVGAGSGQQNAPMLPADDDRVAAKSSTLFLQNTAVPLCGKCHSGNDPRGKFDITTYPNLTAEQKAIVWDRLTTSDESKRMPRTADNKAGQLTPAQLREFARN